jgi:hypothetical protein
MSTNGAVGTEIDPYEAAWVDDVCHLAPNPTWAWHVCQNYGGSVVARSMFDGHNPTLFWQLKRQFSIKACHHTLLALTGSRKRTVEDIVALLWKIRRRPTLLDNDVTPQLLFELETLIFGDILRRNASAASVVPS